MAPKILIMGGGIGGLCLAQGLKKHNIPFHVYERDRDINHRGQGYRIRVAGKAVEALQYCLGDEMWRLFELTCAECNLGTIPVVDAQSCEVSEATMPGGGAPASVESTAGGGRLLSDNAGVVAKPYTVDRSMLRETLLRGIGKENMSWDKAFKSYEVDTAGVKVEFVDGTSATGTILVGADGASSRVKAQYLPDHQAFDTGLRLVYGKTPMTFEFMEIINSAVMQRMSNIKDRSRGMDTLAMVLEPTKFLHREEMKEEGFDVPHDYVYWAIGGGPKAMGLPEGDVPQISHEEAAALALKVTKDWHASLRCLIEHQMPGQTSLIPLNSCEPKLPMWTPSKHITLLGDSVHKMIPAGTGAIAALRDAHNLCEQIVASVDTSGDINDTAIGAYESAMREYAGQMIQLSMMAGRKIFQHPDDDRKIGDAMSMNKGEKMGGKW